MNRSVQKPGSSTQPKSTQKALAKLIISTNSLNPFIFTGEVELNLTQSDIMYIKK